jgi:hypothetical protein
MPLEKLAKYMNTTVDELESNLLCFKHKMMNIVWTKGTSALQGEFQSESEVIQSQLIMFILTFSDFPHDLWMQLLILNFINSISND